MSILQTQTTSFKAELYQGEHDLLTDTLMMALYTGDANLNQTTTMYTSANEVSGVGYIPGGAMLTGALISADGFTAYVSFNNVEFGAAVTARCALIYNASKGNKSIAVLDFGSDKTSSNFTVVMPSASASTALIRSSN